MHWLPNFTFLDIETTGSPRIHDRVLEVALIKIENGQLSVKWETLINPDISIPKQITDLTGISDAMVKDAPAFKYIAGDLYGHLEGSIMVAHKSSFDYGFLKAEFKRLGATLRQCTFCTAALSRKLYPLAQGHSLNAIMCRFGLTTKAHHHGMGDVQLMLDFLEAAKQELGSVTVLAAINA